jgi:hypothetical protein
VSHKAWVAEKQGFQSNVGKHQRSKLPLIQPPDAFSSDQQENVSAEKLILNIREP